jgi:uncharacterized protein YegP (UPF0339 family)
MTTVSPGPRRLRVGVEVSDTGLAVASIWVGETRALQAAHLRKPLLASVKLAGTTVLVEALDHPLVARGKALAGRGHSRRALSRGLIRVSVPFSDPAELNALQITVADVSRVRRDRNDAEAAALLEAPTADVDVLGSLTIAQLASHPDWPAVAAQLGLPVDPAHFEIYVDRASQYRWRLRRPDGEIVADSGQGYRRLADCEADLAWIRGNAAFVPVQYPETGGLPQGEPGEID